jgi:hypothetical protein
VLRAAEGTDTTQENIQGWFHMEEGGLALPQLHFIFILSSLHILLVFSSYYFLKLFVIQGCFTLIILNIA